MGQAYLDVRPRLGRMPTMAQCPEGPRTELPVSVPSPASPRLAASPAAAACDGPSMIPWDAGKWLGDEAAQHASVDPGLP